MDEQHRVQIRRMRTTRRDRRGHDDRRSRTPSRAVRAGPSPGTWDAPSALRRNDSYTAEVHVPKPTAGAARGRDHRRVRAPGRRARGHGAVQAAASQAIAASRRASRGTEPASPTAEVHFAPWDGVGLRPRRLPDRQPLGPRRRRRHGALAVRAHVGALEAAQGGRRAPDGLRPRGLRLPARGRSSATSSGPPRRPSTTRRWTTSSTSRTRGYCQHYAGAMALMLRMGGVSGARRDRLLARRLLGAQEGLDRPRHRRPRLGRGLVRRVRLGRDRPDAGRHPRPLAGRRARRPPPSAPATAGRGDTGAAARGDDERPEPDRRPPGAAARPRRRPSPGRARPTRRRALVMWVGRSCVAASRCVLGVLLFLRRPRGKTPMDRAINEVEDAMRRVGRPVTDGTTLTQLERRLGSHSPEVAAYLRALAAGRYAPAPPPPPRTGRRALRRALAQGLGFGGGCGRCGRCRRARARRRGRRARARSRSRPGPQLGRRSTAGIDIGWIDRTEPYDYPFRSRSTI